MSDIERSKETSTNNGWISVEDRLPENRQRVLIARKNDGEIYIGKYSIFNHFVVSFKYWLDVMDVSHWQPLPEPPESR